MCLPLSIVFSVGTGHTYFLGKSPSNNHGVGWRGLGAISCAISRSQIEPLAPCMWLRAYYVLLGLGNEKEDGVSRVTCVAPLLLEHSCSAHFTYRQSCLIYPPITFDQLPIARVQVVTSQNKCLFDITTERAFSLTLLSLQAPHVSTLLTWDP